MMGVPWELERCGYGEDDSVKRHQVQQEQSEGVRVALEPTEPTSLGGQR